jgi:HK97 family phage prohead protease
MSAQIRFKTMVAEAPTAKGSFVGHVVANPMAGDTDHERINSWRNLPTVTPLLYGHSYHDLVGATVGEAYVEAMPDGSLTVKAQLDLENPMAVAIHERLLLPSDHPYSLGGLSVGFGCQEAWTDPTTKVRVLENCELLELSIVKHPAQTSTITQVKSRQKVGARNSAADLEKLQSIHDETVALGAMCATPTVGHDVYGGPAKSSRCSCGATVSGSFRKMDAIANGKRLGVLAFRSCPRCGEKEITGANNAIRRFGADHWAKFITAQLRAGRTKRSASPTNHGGPSSTAMAELNQINNLLSELQTGTARKSRTAQGDQWLREDAALRAKEREDRQALEEQIAALSLMAPLPSEQERQERDERAFAEYAAQVAQRDQQRAEQAEERDRVSRARRGPDVQVIRG